MIRKTRWKHEHFPMCSVFFYWSITKASTDIAVSMVSPGQIMEIIQTRSWFFCGEVVIKRESGVPQKYNGLVQRFIIYYTP